MLEKWLLLIETLEALEQDLRRFYLDMRKDMIKRISKHRISSIMDNQSKEKILSRLHKHFITLAIKPLEMTNGQKEKA